MMLRQFKVSVVIPAYNAETTLVRAVASCLNQSVPPTEIIVVDNASNDKTLEIARQLPVKLVQEPRRGVSFARNAGIQASMGDLVAFLDADDVWMPEKLAVVLPCFVNPATALVAHNFSVGTEVVNCFAARFRLLDEFAALLLGNYVSTSTVVVRREVLIQAGMFPIYLKLAEDYWLWLAIARQYRLHVLSDVLTRRYNSRLSLTAQHPRQVQGFGLMVAAWHVWALYRRPFALMEVLTYLCKRLFRQLN